MSSSPLFEIGSALAEVFTFLAPVEQQELRTTNTVAAQWFDSAAENGSLPFYAHATGKKWKYSPVHPKTAESPDVVTANVRNYYFCTMNTYSTTNEAVAAPRLEGEDEYTSTNVAVHSFILQGFKCKQKLYVTGLNGIKSIDKRFCEKVTAEEIEFDGANQLQKVTMHWMLRCPNLKRVVFKGAMPQLTSVSNCWMAECPKLESIDFSGITALERIDERFLFNSPNVTTLDFAPFAGSLKYFGSCFLGHVTKVANLAEKLAVLTNVKEVGTVGQYAPPALRAFAKDKTVVSA